MKETIHRPCFHEKEVPLTKMAYNLVEVENFRSKFHRFSRPDRHARC